MSATLTVWFSAALAAGSVGLTLVHAGAAVIVATIATVIAGFAATTQNTPVVRFGYYLAVLGQAASCYLATHEPAFALAALAFAVPLHASELVRRRSNTLAMVQQLLGFVVGAVLVVLARGVGLWLLALAPAALLALMSGSLSFLVAHRAADLVRRSPLRVGEPVPDFELPYRDGDGTFKLSEQRGGHLLLVFVRGDWCPICHVMMRIVAREAALLEEHDIELVIITPTEGQMNEALRRGLSLRSRMLYDAKAAQARAFGLVDGKRRGEDVPVPVTLLVGPDGVLLDVSRPDDVTRYSSGSRIREALRAFETANASASG